MRCIISGLFQLFLSAQPSLCVCLTLSIVPSLAFPALPAHPMIFAPHAFDKAGSGSRHLGNSNFRSEG